MNCTCPELKLAEHRIEGYKYVLQEVLKELPSDSRLIETINKVLDKEDGKE